MTTKRKIACLGFVSVLTLVIAAPVLSDDTELLLSTNQTAAKPNILFLVDTSGSMNSLEHTLAFYDSALTYIGTCDNSKYYWTDSGIAPICSVDRAIDKVNFVCVSAGLQVISIGSYTGVLAQYRSDSGSGNKWQTIALSQPSAIVECDEDSGIHGDGTAGGLYAKAGTDTDKFTNNPDNELAWGSFPANQKYSMYDGNYLNWLQERPEEDIKRIDIIKKVVKKVFTAYDNVNIGLMPFNATDGGPVLHAVSDINTNRALFESRLDSLDGVSNSPLSEAFYEGALYWNGLPAHYGELVNEFPTDPNALLSTAPEVYKQPVTVGGTCPRNVNIILSDGAPGNDADTELLAPTLPGFEAALGRTSCTYVAQGDCLDDIAEYLFKHDINTTEPGQQFVRTFGIGFFSSKDDATLLEDTANAGGGRYFSTTDSEGLVVALLSILDEITTQSLTFTSPSVAVNAFNRTQNLNDLYMSVFQSDTKTHWPGNLKKFRIVDSTITDANGAPAVDPATGFFRNSAMSFWTVGSPDGADVTAGGAANVLPDPMTRNVYTNNGSDSNLTAGSNALSVSNEAAYVAADFGLTGAADEPTVADMISWVNGADVKDEDSDPATVIRYVMGDPLHAQPAAVDYGGATPDVVVFAATNDGYLHAINGNTGVELWSFVPREMLDNFAKLFADRTAQYKQYGIDGDIVPVVSDQNGNGIIDGSDFVYIVFGLRRGGNSYYALDVTDRNVPKLLWNVSYPGFGQSWSAPVVTRVNTTEAGLNSEKAVVIIGAGYDTAHDTPSEPVIDDGEGAGIFMLDLKTGNKIWSASSDVSADLQLATMTRAFPTKIKVIDINGDGFADRMYAADVGGQVWRFDIFSGEPASSLVTGGVIARFGFEGAASSGEGPRRIYNSPDVSIFTDVLQNRRYIAVSIGTGYRAHPLNSDAVDRFYSLRDPDIFNQLSQAQYDSYSIATDANMVEISGLTQTVLDSADRGWRFTLPPTQMILADSTTFNNTVFFVAFSPVSGAASDCDVAFGQNTLYEVSIANGDPIVNNLDALDPANADNARQRTLAQGGIAPAPAILFPGPEDDCTGAACSPPPIGCVGLECFDPGFLNYPVRTLWTQDGIE
jgi:type IV pilus assembly protein PilY1